MSRGLSVRWRLTLFYSLISVVSATVLLGGIYALVSHPPKSTFYVGSHAAPPPDVLNGPGPKTGSTFGQVVFQAKTDAVDQTLNGLLWWSGVGLLLTAAVSVGVGWVFAGRVLAPVHTITSRARAISAHSLDERVSLGGPHDELRELADTFDSLLDRIHQAFAGERRLVATMSHELRTPLANQQAALDVALANPEATVAELRSAAEVALGQTDRANRTIDALLVLARVQSGLEPARPEPVDLMALVTDAVDRVREEEGSLRSWQLHLTPVEVPGDAELLDRAIGNLLQNAERHNLPGSEGWIDVRLLRRGSEAVLVVSSTGARIDPGDAAGLTLPFRRGARDRVGSDRGVGLGLSIVQAVADHHGGRLTLTPLEPGGLAAELVLPLGAGTEVRAQRASKGEGPGVVGPGN
jgi:signal transduction histidine kinase